MHFVLRTFVEQTKVRKKKNRPFHYLIARWRFRNDILAQHSLRFAGSIAGVIDQAGDGRVCGWVYDAQRPDETLPLEICVDGVPVKHIVADRYREDLAVLFHDTGIHGFDCSIEEFEKSNAAKCIISVRVADRPRYILGAINLETSFPAARRLRELEAKLSEMTTGNGHDHKFRELEKKFNEMAASNGHDHKFRDLEAKFTEVFGQKLPLERLASLEQVRAQWQASIPRLLDKLEELKKIKALEARVSALEMAVQEKNILELEE